MLTQEVPLCRQGVVAPFQRPVSKCGIRGCIDLVSRAKWICGSAARSACSLKPDRMAVTTGASNSNGRTATTFCTSG